MKLRNSIFAITGVLSASIALAQNASHNGVYVGTIGSHGIVLEIGSVGNADNHDADMFQGRYFYRDHGVAIPLKMKAQSDERLLMDEYHDTVPTGARWLLIFHGADANGQCCKCDTANGQASPNQPRLNISLTLVPGTENQLHHQEAYNKLLLDFPVTTGPEVRIGGQISYAMQSDKRFPGTSLPRLLRFPDPAVMSKVNQELSHEFDAHRLRAAECLFGNQQTSYSGSYEEEYDVALLNRDVLSISGGTSTICGDSAYPNNKSDSLIYDLHTAKRFDFYEDAASVFTTATLPYQTLEKLYYKYGGKTSQDCGEMKADFNQETVIYFTKEGLAVNPSNSLPHVVQACAETVTIPYAAIRKLVRSDTPFRFLIQP
jgi:hypothetical protein